MAKKKDAGLGELVKAFLDIMSPADALLYMADVTGEPGPPPKGPRRNAKPRYEKTRQTKTKALLEQELRIDNVWEYVGEGKS